MTRSLDGAGLVSKRGKCLRVTRVSRVQLKVMNNNLFSVEPKKGRLSAGEACTVTLTYQHTMLGTDRISVMFKLSRGRQILVRSFINDHFSPCLILSRGSVLK